MCSKCEKEKEERNRKTQSDMQASSNFYQAMNFPYANYQNIPRRFVDKTVDNYSATTKKQKEIKSICKRYVEQFESVLNKGISMVLCGKPGTGKTHLAYGIINSLQKQLKTAVLVSASDMTSTVKSGYRDKDGLSPEHIVSNFVKFKLLIIDEVGVQVDSESEKRIFFDIINKRYSEMLPTILISNLERGELTKFVGERVIDRMNENQGIVFAFDWDSFRK